MVLSASKMAAAPTVPILLFCSLTTTSEGWLLNTLASAKAASSPSWLRLSDSLDSFSSEEKAWAASVKEPEAPVDGRRGRTQGGSAAEPPALAEALLGEAKGYTGDLVSGEADLLQVDVVLKDRGQPLEALVVDLVPGEVEHLDALVGRKSLR